MVRFVGRLGAALVALLLVIPVASAEMVTKLGNLEISKVWTRATPPSAKVGAAYVTITNLGETPDRLVGVSSPMAGRGEVHETKMAGGIMKMRRLEDGLEIPPGETVELKPGGHHVMLMGLAGPIVEGKTLPLTLVFENAGKITLEPRAAKLGASAPAHDHSGH